MITVKIKYIDLDDNEQVVEKQFHMNELDAMKLESQLEGGLDGFMTTVETLQQIEEPTQQQRAQIISIMMDTMEKVVRLSYGERTKSGGFRKDDKATQEFLENPAYTALILDLLLDQELTQRFWSNVMPTNKIEKLPEPTRVVRK